MTLNTIMADSVFHVAAQLDKLLKAGKSKEEAIQQVARETLIAHKRIIYNGNGYDPIWQKEAAERGLPNLKTTPQALKELDKPKNLKVFSDMKVLNEHEVKARKHVFEEDYFKKLVIEAKTLRHMSAQQILPAAIEWSTSLGTSLAHAKSSKWGGKSLEALTAQIDLAHKGVADLDNLIQKAAKFDGDSSQAATFAETEILPALNHVRQDLDKLETFVPAKKWPLPTYHAMLFHQD
jgi:glutamine synthetase